MGAGQSSQIKNGVTPQESKELERADMFSLIFMRLLKSTDILDIRALTKGPGACGDYIILLEKELNKEFNKVKLNSQRDGIEEFLYAKSKTLSSPSPADQAACRSLAIFYLRALQLVSALTLSIYTPPDLVSRIRNRVFQTALNEQKRSIGLSYEEKEEMRVKRENWFLKFFRPGSAGTYVMNEKPYIKYLQAQKQLVYTDEESNEYKAKISIKEPDEYEVDEKYKLPDSYWIELTHPKTDMAILRVLASPDKKAWNFTGTLDSTDGFSQNWTDMLMETFLNYIEPQKPAPNNAAASRPSYGYGRRYGGRLSVRRTRGGANNNNTKSENKTTRKNTRNTSLNLSPTTTLPRQFQDSYKAMVAWSTNFATWTEASPASYRSILLYIQPSLPSASASSYLCIDNWANKPLRLVPPFSSLESLYFDKDDGTARPENQERLTLLVTKLRSLYEMHSPPPKAGNVKRGYTSFADVIMPPLNEVFRDKICNKKTAQGDVMLEAAFAPILEKAQKDIQALYKSHFDAAFAILMQLFIVTKSPLGESLIGFSDSFTKSEKGARQALEDLIREARGVIAAHYIAVDTIYYTAIQDVLKAKV
jgi:hypothetical protein